MARLSRLLLLLVPVVLGIVSTTLPGGAQEAGGSRFAFADTTLLRDTLDLHFTRLFPLADSLQVPPDTLRALSVRYRWSLERLVVMADSLGMPVDSVGPVMMRERFNPLAVGAAGAARATDFTYNSSYARGQTNSGWRNSGDFSFRNGGAFVQNSTSIQLDRYAASNGTSLRQTRNSATELGWRFSPNFSLGGRVSLERYDSRDASSQAVISQTKNEYQFSLRSRQQPTRGMSSTLNVLAGLLDLRDSEVDKQGLSGNVSSRVRYNLGSWLVQELNGVVDGNLAHTRQPSSVVTQNTQDFSANVRGLVSMFQTSRAGLKSNLSYRHVQVENPQPAGISRVLTDQWGVDGTVRLRQDNERYVDLTQKTSTSKQATVLGSTSRNTRREDGFSANGRYQFFGWGLEPRFSNTFANSDFPSRSDSGGYHEFLHNRSLEAVLNKQLSRRINAQFTGNIALASFRYTEIGKFSSLPVSRDEWRQSWRAKASYSTSTRFTTSLSMEVAKRSLIQIPSASTGTNNNSRSYRSEWTWSYRLLPDLTATQTNTINADYLEYPFFPDNNRLSLDFNSFTTLNATVTPHLNITLSHSARQTPSGDYTRYPDNLSYFERADETRSANLRATIAYSPSPAFSLSFRPSYFSSARNGTVSGAEVPQRTNNTFEFSGGANVSLPVGLKGTLRADVARSYRAERSVSYTSGVAQPSPLSEIDYWNGSVQLTWAF